MKKIKYDIFDSHNSVTNKSFGGLNHYHLYGLLKVPTLIGPAKFYSRFWMMQLNIIDKHYDNLMPPGFTQVEKFVKNTSRLFRRFKQWIKQSLSK